MVLVDGEHLRMRDVWRVAAENAPVGVRPEARTRMERGREVVERLAAADKPVYGVNTGVGLLADVRIPADQLEQLQRNVVRSHACGVGEPLAREVVRAMMLIRANTLAKGYSGIHSRVADAMCDLLNRDVTPVTPSRGSVGASGDLAPLAHIALVLIGEGRATVGGVEMSGAAALEKAGLAPLTLGSKDGISLINGTQAMLAIGCLELRAARVLAWTADVVCALTLDALRGTPRAFDARAHALRPHPGQVRSAAQLRRLLAASAIRASHLTCRRVQDAYSLRCAPQVHGAVRDALAEASRAFAIELNAATDNPLVIDEEILSAGNFHGEPIALPLDYLAIALAALAGISERRIDRLVNPALNEELPPFLTDHAGLESGYMMAQVTAAALVAEIRVLATPASPGSITTSGNKEDFVSMGMTAALKLQRVVANARLVLAIEALAAARAIEFLRPLKTSPPLEQAMVAIREVAPQFRGDRALGADIEKMAAAIGAGRLLV